jgi:hypothetical protein
VRDRSRGSHSYTYAARVWDSSIVKGPFSVAPCQALPVATNEPLFRVQDGKPPQWKYITGLLENAIYGGRVDNAYDILVLRTYLGQFFNSNMVTTSTGARTQSIPGTRGVVLPSSTHLPDYLVRAESLLNFKDPY